NFHGITISPEKARHAGSIRKKAGWVDNTAPPPPVKTALRLRTPLWRALFGNPHDCAGVGRGDERGVPGQIACLHLRLPLYLFTTPLLERFLGQLDGERAFVEVDGDDIAVFEESDGTAGRRLGRDVADRNAPCPSGEPPVGDEGN